MGGPGSGRKPSQTTPTTRLSPREQEVLHWVGHGKTNPEIGQIIGCSQFTVKCHLTKIREKLDVHNKAQAVSAWQAKKSGY
jgi:DNA-binding CsgD family transcriptional regulator